MSRTVSIATAMVLVGSGCTTGGRIFAGASAVTAVVAISELGPAFDDNRSPGDHTEVAAAWFGAIALACAITSVAFELFAPPAGSTPEPTPTVIGVTMAPASPLIAHTPSRDPAAERFTQQAYFAARIGHCAAVRVLGDKVHAADASYFATVFAVDPTIARCM